mmetsp:Transcript_48624/g.145223  ORF Transcript_48624/g.145223 Transcript_48624/m.145223 type:complete len:215 (-) Transcript_48624:202-846(-)
MLRGAALAPRGCSQTSAAPRAKTSASSASWRSRSPLGGRRGGGAGSRAGGGALETAAAHLESHRSAEGGGAHGGLGGRGDAEGAARPSAPASVAGSSEASSRASKMHSPLPGSPSLTAQTPTEARRLQGGCPSSGRPSGRRGAAGGRRSGGGACSRAAVSGVSQGRPEEEQEGVCLPGCKESLLLQAMIVVHVLTSLGSVPPSEPQAAVLSVLW